MSRVVELSRQRVIKCISTRIGDSDYSLSYSKGLLTVGKTYNIIDSDSIYFDVNSEYYYIICDNGTRSSFLKRCFITIEEHREQLLKELIND